MNVHQEQITYNAMRGIMVALGVIDADSHPDWPMLLCIVEEYIEHLTEEAEQ